MKTLGKVFQILWNKYVITVILLLVWVLFFDKNDLFSQASLAKELRELESARKYYQEGIAKNRNALNELRNSPKTLEKFARETYLMKRDHEEIFVIITDNTVK
jgi:cell division protein DivIC